MVCLKGELVAVRSDGVAGDEGSGVVKNDIEVGGAGADLFGESADFVQPREIGDQRLGAELPGHRSGPFFGAAVDQYGGAGGRQSERRRPADARTGTGHQYGLAGHVW